MTDNKITLDSLMKNYESLDTPPETSIEKQEVELATSTVELTPQEREKVEKIKQEINIQDSTILSIYGNQSQKNIAQFSESILSEVRSKDVGNVGDLMSDLMVRVKELDITKIPDNGFWSKIPFVKSTKRNVEKYLARYDSMEHQIDSIQGQLENSRMELLKDIATFDKLYEKNVEYFQDLQLYIVAGEEKIHEMQTTVIPELLKEAENADDPMAMQVVHDFQEQVNRFEKKIYDLKTSKTVAIQTAPQIKLIQNNDKMLVDKVTDAIHNTIPLWKSQVVIALGMNKQAQVLEMQQEVSKTTNDLLKRNSEALKKNTLEVAKEAERSIVDIDTLQQVNDNLISTIEESIEIHNQAKKARQEAEIQIEKIESDLQTALAKTVKS